MLQKVWTLPSQRPIAPVEHRYDRRYLVGFVHPASGRTVWHVASTVTTVTSELFSVELDAFAREVGASPTKQIVLVLDGAGLADWAQQSQGARALTPPSMSTCFHLLFLPPHAPELQPAEHLWALVATDEYRVAQPALYLIPTPLEWILLRHGVSCRRVARHSHPQRLWHRTTRHQHLPPRVVSQQHCSRCISTCMLEPEHEPRPALSSMKDNS